MPVGFPEFYENAENRCPVILLLDTSGSMAGEPILELGRGVDAFKQDILRDSQASLSVEVAIVTFGPVHLLQDFVTVDRLAPPQLRANGTTPMGEAIEYALDLLEQRKITYKSNGIQYFRPWVFLITDGAPNPESPWLQAAQRLKSAEAEGRLLFFAVGVQGANFEILQQFSATRPPVMLEGLKFESLFLWLSKSMKRVSASRVGGSMVELPPIEGWGKVAT